MSQAQPRVQGFVANYGEIMLHRLGFPVLSGPVVMTDGRCSFTGRRRATVTSELAK